MVKGIGLDHRIGPHFLQPGPGYGGSCFPKDTSALIAVAGDAGYDFELLRAVIEADEEQRRGWRRRCVRPPVVGSTAAGSRCGALHSRPGTDDVRESPALRIAALLQADGAEVVAFDPEASTDSLRMAPDPVSATADADVLLVATEWKELPGSRLQLRWPA